MRVQRQLERQGYLLPITLGAIVVAFIEPVARHHCDRHCSVCRCDGYSAQVGYAVGAVFDFAKALLPVALLVLFARHAFFFVVIIGFA